MKIDFAEKWSDDTETSEDESEVFGLVKLFGYDKNLPPILTPGFRATDTDDDSDSDQDMTDEESGLYSEQVEKSGVSKPSFCFSYGFLLDLLACT